MIIVVVAAIIVLFAGWFAWMSILTAKENLVQKQVQRGLKAGILVVERTAPRVLVRNDGGYYVPDVLENQQVPAPNSARRDVYDVLLQSVNENSGLPLMKVSGVSLDSDLTSVIDAHATVKFDVIFGITKVLIVGQSAPLPHYAHATGSALAN